MSRFGSAVGTQHARSTTTKAARKSHLRMFDCLNRKSSSDADSLARRNTTVDACTHCFSILIPDSHEQRGFNVQVPTLEKHTSARF